MHRHLRTAPIHDFPFRQHSGRLPAQTASPFTGRTVDRHPAKSDGFGFPLSGVTVFQLPRFFIPCRQRAPHGSMQDRQSKQPRRAAPRGHGGGKSRSGRERAGRRIPGNRPRPAEEVGKTQEHAIRRTRKAKIKRAGRRTRDERNLHPTKQGRSARRARQNGSAEYTRRTKCGE